MVGAYKVVRDPVHNIITLRGPTEGDGLDAQPILDTREFQRLRRVRQLGVSWFTYPGAEHSRFAHSLGVYHLAKRITERLLQVSPTIAEELHELAPTIHAAALVHDVGHGPFSHVFERVFRETRHEQWTVKVLTSKETEIHQRLGEQVSVQDVVDIINQTHPKRYAVDIVSSQLDADRMDYLLRDALMTGVDYGIYDVDWIINSLRIGTWQAGREEPIRRLCVDGTKGMHAIEQYVLARLFMYQQVYLHKATRATEALLINIFRLAAHMAADGKLPPVTPTPIRDIFEKQGQVDVGTYLAVDDFLVLSTLVAWSRLDAHGENEQAWLARMCDRVVNRRRPYRCVVLDERKYPSGLRLRQHLESTNNYLNYHCYLDASEEIMYKDVLYFLGEKEYEDALNLALLVCDAAGMCKPIELRSRLLDKIARDKFEVRRFFYDERYQEEFENLFGEFGISHR